jgi:hypothetical protein
MIACSKFLACEPNDQCKGNMYDVSTFPRFNEVQLEMFALCTVKLLLLLLLNLWCFRPWGLQVAKMFGRKVK